MPSALRSQAARALPLASKATCGESIAGVPADSVCGVPSVPSAPMGRDRTTSVPAAASVRIHVASALPPGSTATRGSLTR